jgi:signal transduction histidine kinase/tetratricopeptide (TPR) repeat protein
MANSRWLQSGPKGPSLSIVSTIAAAVLLFATPAGAAEERLSLVAEPDPHALIDTAAKSMNSAPDRALALSEEILAMAEAPADAGFRARLAYIRSRALTHLTRYAESIEEGEVALALMDSGDRAMRADVLTTLAISHGRTQNSLKAFDMLQESLAIREDLDDLSGQAASLIAIAELYFDVGLTAKSVDTFKIALAKARAAGDKRVLAITLNNFAYALNFVGDPAEAISYLDEAQALSGEMGMSRMAAFVNVNKSRALFDLGRFEDSEQFARSGLALARDYGHADLVSGAQLMLALNARHRGALNEAAAFAREARANADKNRNFDKYREILRLLAKIAESQRDYKSASRYRAEEAEHFEKIFKSMASRSAALFEAETKLAAQEVELEMLKRDSEIANLAAARATLFRNAAVLVATMLAAMLIFFALLLREKARRKAQILRKNEELTEAYRDLEVANRVKSNFLAVISHELKTPLNSIIGFSDILANGKSQSGSNEFMSDYAKVINAQGRNLLRLVSDILLFARTEAGAVALKEGAGALRSIVANAIAQTRESRPEADDRVDVRLDDPDLELRCDPVQLANCLARILDNALKFSPAASRVSLSARQATGGDLEIEIADSGVGVVDGEAPRYFDVLSQGDQSHSRRQGGAGLGLPIANLIVAAHGGRIEISKRTGGGTIVSAILPASRLGAAEGLAAA